MTALPAVLTTWFASRGWQPRRHQLAMLEEARAGHHALLIAATGAGKTLAGFLPTLAELIEDLEGNHPGIKDRLVESGTDGQADLRRFVNLYVNDEDVRFTGGLQTGVSDGDQVVVLPAVAGG